MRQEVHFARPNDGELTIIEFTWSSQADRFARQLLGLGYEVEVYRFDTDGRMIGFWEASGGKQNDNHSVLHSGQGQTRGQ